MRVPVRQLQATLQPPLEGFELRVAENRITLRNDCMMLFPTLTLGRDGSDQRCLVGVSTNCEEKVARSVTPVDANVPMPASAQSAETLYPLELEAFDRMMLDEDSRRRPMVYPQILELTGKLQRPAFEKALRLALDRHPLFESRLSLNAQGVPYWRASNKHSVKVTWRSAPAKSLGVGAYRLHLPRTAGARIIVDEYDGRTTLHFLWHHAFTDGLGSFRMIGDLLAFYALQIDPAAAVSVVPMERHRLKGRGEPMLWGPELDVKPVTASDMMMTIVSPVVAKEAMALAGARRARFDQPRQPFPGLILKDYDPKSFAAIRKAAENKGLTAHELLSFCTYRFVAKWNQAHGRTRNGLIRVAIPVDLRGRGDEATPASNIVGMFYPSIPVDECLDDERLLQRVKSDAIRARTEQPAPRLNQALRLGYAIPKLVAASFRGNRCMSTCVLSNVGDPSRRLTATLPRRDGKLVAGDVTVENMYGISPLRRGTRLAIGVQSYNRRLTLSMRTDPYRFDLKDTQRMMDEFVAVIESVVSDWR
jgi:NRPS condensation-like uncharacterized protein